MEKNSSFGDRNNDIEVLDVENYQAQKDQQFSHQALVMRCMNKTIESGSRELHSGWFDERQDRHGNTVKAYKEDTREIFIEAVKTCEMVMICDYDKTASDNIQDVHDEINKLKKEFLDKEKEYFENLSPRDKQVMLSKGVYYEPGVFNASLRYLHEYKRIEIEYYRKIFAELTNLTRRLDYYMEADFEA